MKNKFLIIFIAFIAIVGVIGVSSAMMRTDETEELPDEEESETEVVFPEDLSHVHAFSKETILTEATCTEFGVKQYACECGDTYTENILKKIHTHVDGYCSVCSQMCSRFSIREYDHFSFYVDYIDFSKFVYTFEPDMTWEEFLTYENASSDFYINDYGYVIYVYDEQSQGFIESGSGNYVKATDSMTYDYGYQDMGNVDLASVDPSTLNTYWVVLYYGEGQLGGFAYLEGSVITIPSTSNWVEDESTLNSDCWTIGGVVYEKGDKLTITSDVNLYFKAR